MLALELVFNTSALGLLASNLARFSNEAGQIKPIANELQQIIFEANREQILSQGRRGNTPYPPLKPGYAAQKAKLYPGKPILRATDRLFNAFSGTDESGYSIEETNTSLGIVFNVPYAGIHQTGTKFLDRRPPSVIIQQDAEQIGQEVVNNSQKLFQVIFG